MTEEFDEKLFSVLPLVDQKALVARWTWEAKARPEQRAPDDYCNLFACCGRGWGKTRFAAEETWWKAWRNPDWRVGVIAPTFGDARTVCFEGESGLLNCIPSELVANYRKDILELNLVNGSIISGYSTDDPNRFRGPQHHFLWLEELSSWNHPQENWDMSAFGLRLGAKPQRIITSTPKPIQIVRNLINDKRTTVIRGSTYDNKKNLPDSFFEELQKYEGTNLGQQELYGEVLDLSLTAVFHRNWWKWWPYDKPLPNFDLIIQSYDTAFSEKQTADDTAWTVWGLFKAKEGRDSYSALMLDCGDAKIGFPDLREFVIKEFSKEYGVNNKKADGILVENKGSGISLIQELRRADIPAYEYNPGGADKLQRAHLVSHLVKDGFMWIPETRRIGGKCQPVSWAEKWFEQISYFGPDTMEDGSKKDYVDTTTQFLAFMSKCGWLRSSGLPQQQKSYWRKTMTKNPYGG